MVGQEGPHARFASDRHEISGVEIVMAKILKAYQ